MKNGIYLHYKGDKYQVLHTATHSESKEVLVIYRAMNSRKIWARPEVMFSEMVMVDAEEVPRFKYLGKT